MRYSEWNALSSEQRKNIIWHRRPHIRTVKLFGIAFIFVFIIVIFGISKNSIVHLNKKPTANDAFAMAKIFVKDNLKQPANAVFPGTGFTPQIDTVSNNYQISSSVKIENMAGKMMRSNWVVKMHYTGGDWSDRNSWQVSSVDIEQ